MPWWYKKWNNFKTFWTRILDWVWDVSENKNYGKEFSKAYITIEHFLAQNITIFMTNFPKLQYNWQLKISHLHIKKHFQSGILEIPWVWKWDISAFSFGSKLGDLDKLTLTEKISNIRLRLALYVDRHAIFSEGG